MCGVCVGGDELATGDAPLLYPGDDVAPRTTDTYYGDVGPSHSHYCFDLLRFHQVLALVLEIRLHSSFDHLMLFSFIKPCEAEIYILHSWERNSRSGFPPSLAWIREARVIARDGFGDEGTIGEKGSGATQPLTGRFL